MMNGRPRTTCTALSGNDLAHSMDGAKFLGGHKAAMSLLPSNPVMPTVGAHMHQQPVAKPQIATAHL